MNGPQHTRKLHCSSAPSLQREGQLASLRDLSIESRNGSESTIPRTIIACLNDGVEESSGFIIL